MARVIQLEEGQDPPADMDCYIVARDPAGRFYIADSDIGFVRSARAASYPISDEERTSTIDRAKRYADKHGVRAVFVLA